MNLSEYRSRIEREIKTAIEKMGEKTQLRDSCSYAVGSGGKRIRPMIVLMIADALGHGLDAIDSALSVEYFHTASLIADDLPCMDNDDERRSRPSLHKAFGESVALLASYTLIAAGYGGIYENGKRMNTSLLFANRSANAVSAALEAATRCAGLQGATLGQYYDLYPPDSSWETFKRIIYLKTVTLFEISFSFGWLFGGGEESALPKLKECAYHLGLSFQISDDWQDGDNSSSVCSREKMAAIFQKSMIELERGLRELGLWTAPFQELLDGLHSRFLASGGLLL